MHTYIHTHIHACIRTYIHTYTYIHPLMLITRTTVLNKTKTIINYGKFKQDSDFIKHGVGWEFYTKH